MPVWKTRASKIVLAALAMIPVVLLAVYLTNPRGVPSLDPRLRILGTSLYRVAARSMAPELAANQVVLVRTAFNGRRGPERGDIIIFRESRSGQVWVKRVVGLPGDQVEIRHGQLHVNGGSVGEPYLSPAHVRMDYSLEFPMHQVAADSYFLLGDNRDNSEDSRIFGDVPHQAVIGKVIGKL